MAFIIDIAESSFRYTQRIARHRQRIGKAAPVAQPRVVGAARVAAAG
jgi:hypothetical protein